MASSTFRLCFAKLSATVFLSREIQLKEITSKDVARDLKSAKIPYKPAREDPDLRALTRIAESDSAVPTLYTSILPPGGRGLQQLAVMPHFEQE
ncbi:hypothetical protein F2Q69_00057611 [Brassica cretica]|uniref:Uncharacterized protein n=1 Tax=Brassica cretica TaxID=69181 RepID=A0A8S9MZE6_BRACR|nr:hypothetical protein F2Q69_00057611 [Brassica cretica]